MWAQDLSHVVGTNGQGRGMKLLSLEVLFLRSSQLSKQISRWFAGGSTFIYEDRIVYREDYAYPNMRIRC